MCVDGYFQSLDERYPSDNADHSSIDVILPLIDDYIPSIDDSFPSNDLFYTSVD